MIYLQSQNTDTQTKQSSSIKTCPLHTVFLLVFYLYVLVCIIIDWKSKSIGLIQIFASFYDTYKVIDVIHIFESE